MLIKLAVLGLFRRSQDKPFARAYVKPAGPAANRTQAAVNPLVLMGLMGG